MTEYDLLKSLTGLLDDAKEAEQALIKRYDSQFARRTYVRAGFAAVEGLVWLVKQACHVGATNMRMELSRADIALLLDETHELDSSGSARSKPKFLRLPENTRYAFKLAESVFGGPLRIDVQRPEWKAYCTVIRVRNRITHPRSPEELNVLDAEIDSTVEGLSWLTLHTLVFIDQASAKNICG
ncbi:MAG TPA: hypothetical protein VK993_05475 [Chthoniobacterales bacterium]|nr:hypothetical protein [Chthoniobacterales bacterium]